VVCGVCVFVVCVCVYVWCVVCVCVCVWCVCVYVYVWCVVCVCVCGVCVWCVCVCPYEVYQTNEVYSKTLVVRRHKSGGGRIFAFVFSMNVKIWSASKMSENV